MAVRCSTVCFHDQLLVPRPSSFEFDISKVSQLPLSVGLPGTASLDNYVVGPNAQAVDAVRALVEGVGPRLLYLWGRSGTGKTHLAQAVCRHVTRTGGRCAFVPFGSDEEFTPALLEGLETVTLACIDDLHCVAGQAGWERALFNLYNEAERTSVRLLLTGSSSISASVFGLQDLRSRFASILAYQLHELDERERETAVRLRAEERGFEIPREVADYLMRRYPRSMHELIGLVEKLDHSTLAAQRRVTIPFVKRLLDV